MVDVSRRLFLGGALAIASASVAPAADAVLAPLPRIVGDGVHDDHAGLTALFHGEPVNIEGAVVSRIGHSAIQFQAGAIFCVGSPLVLDTDSLFLDGGHFRTSDGFAHRALLVVEPSATNNTITGATFDTTGASERTAAILLRQSGKMENLGLDIVTLI